VVCISETHVTVYDLTVQSKWSWRRSHLTNLHVRIDIDCKKSKYSVVASSNAVTIMPILVKICILFQTFKSNHANSAWLSKKKKSLFKEEKFDK